MIGDHFVGPLEMGNSRKWREQLDPRISKVLRRGKDPPVLPFTRRQLHSAEPFSLIREILRHRQDRTGIVYPRTVEQVELISRWTGYYQNYYGPRTISLLEDKIEQYMFNQWYFAIINTFFAATNQQYSDRLGHDCREYPDHLGHSWHLCKTPQEIYEIAKQITSICEVLNPNDLKPFVTEQVTIREVDKCVEELQQQTLIFGNIYRTQIIALENYLSLPYAESQTIGQGWWSVVPAIVIKRHHHLAFRYRNAPTIDEFRDLVARAFHRQNNREPSVDIQGSWLDNRGVIQTDLQFIPPPPPPSDDKLSEDERPRGDHPTRR